jgi:hypothetical protein
MLHICLAWGHLNELYVARCAPPANCCYSPPPTHPPSHRNTIDNHQKTTTTITTATNECALRSTAGRQRIRNVFVLVEVYLLADSYMHFALRCNAGIAATCSAVVPNV